jgi:hypothetical protein
MENIRFVFHDNPSENDGALPRRKRRQVRLDRRASDLPHEWQQKASLNSEGEQPEGITKQ